MSLHTAPSVLLPLVLAFFFLAAIVEAAPFYLINRHSIVSCITATTVESPGQVRFLPCNQAQSSSQLWEYDSATGHITLASNNRYALGVGALAAAKTSAINYDTKIVLIDVSIDQRVTHTWDFVASEGTGSSGYTDIVNRVLSRVIWAPFSTSGSVSSDEVWASARAPGYYKHFFERSYSFPTLPPTLAPTLPPTKPPTIPPTKAPTKAPTLPPTSAPPTSAPPTEAPWEPPTPPPTVAPPPPTEEPTLAPTEAPTLAPTLAPTEAPTLAPTIAPTEAPTLAPTIAPTEAPTLAPTLAPTEAPTLAPTLAPTEAPTLAPTLAPTEAPTLPPTLAPTVAPTLAPTLAPTVAPTLAPTLAPTVAPTLAPTVAPSVCFTSTIFVQRQTGRWVNGTRTYTEWTVTIQNSRDLYSALVAINAVVGAKITKYLNVNLTVGYTNTYSLPINTYQNGVIPAGSNSVTFTYVTDSGNQASIKLVNNACDAGSFPSICSLDVKTVVNRYKPSPSKAQLNEGVRFNIANNGTSLAAVTRIAFTFSDGAYLSKTTNLLPTSSKNEYICVLANIFPGQISTSCGYEVVAPNGKFPAATVRFVRNICIY